MDTVVVQQYLNFFQDFIELCLTEDWPSNETSDAELRNAFLISRHVEKCLDKLQKNGVINEFLSVLNSHQDSSNNIIKECLSDPPKYVLKKIVASQSNINHVAVAFKLVTELFSVDKLENYLAKLMVEAASRHTLLSNLTVEIPQDMILQFKTKILLSEISSCKSEDPDILSTYNQSFVEMMVVSLLNNEPKYMDAVKMISDAMIKIFKSKENVYQNFWRMLFKVDDRYFIEMCVENADIFMHIVEALCDCGLLLRDGLSTESFYVNLNETELVDMVQKICTRDCLKSQFFDKIRDCDTNDNIEYWESMLS